VVEVRGELVTREYAPVEGTVTAGQKARLDMYAFPGDPRRGLGLAFQEVTYESPLGQTPAWYVPGRTDTWAIFVHGMAGERAEALRTLKPVADAGAHALVILYRNDPGAPPDASNKYQYGRTEWQDLEAAAHYAQNRGAKKIVLVGYSMGGSVVMSFMRNSLLASEVSGLVLDAPMLDFSATVDYAGRRRNLPAFLTWTAKRIAGFRYDVSWGELDYLRDAGGLKAPVLLIHGQADEKVPFSTSESLAQKLPGSAQLEAFPKAQHVGAWNSDPERYERVVREFLTN
jgi:pimeloyl-ACP methyl ester carboxylesterase